MTGQNRGCVTLNNPTPSFTFVYLSPIAPIGYEQVQSFTFQGFLLNAQNGIKLNRTVADLPGGTNDFDKQGIMIGPTFSNLTLTGTYSPAADINYDKSTAASLAELTGYGVGISLNKVFDSVVENCIFQQHGIEEALEYGDDNTITRSRLVGGARVAHSITGLLPSSFYGSGLKLAGNEIVGFHRSGWIYLDGGNAVVIDGNGFEGVSAASAYIQTSHDLDTQVINNHFNYNAAADSTNPFLVFNPAQGLLVLSNTGAGLTIVNHDYWTRDQPTNAYFLNNGPDFVNPNAAGVAFNSPPNPLLLAANNCINIGGFVSLSFPWVLSPVTQRYVLGAGFLVVNFYPQTSSQMYSLRIAARQLGAGGVMSTTVTYTENGNTQTLLSAGIAFPLTSAASAVDTPIALPAGSSGNGYFQVIEDGSQEVERIEFLPVDGLPSLPNAARLEPNK